MDRARANEIAKLFLQKTNPQLLTEQPDAEPLKLFIEDRERSTPKEAFHLDKLIKNMLTCTTMALPHFTKEDHWKPIAVILRARFDDTMESWKSKAYIWILSKSIGMSKDGIKEFLWFAYEACTKERFEAILRERR